MAGSPKKVVRVRGIGDAIERVTEVTGIKKVVEKISEATGDDCGCKARRDKLNNPDLLVNKVFFKDKDKEQE